MIRFLHTSDWQLGMTRHFFSEGCQERYTQARFDAIRTMGRIAEEEGCHFMLVSGDAFESNQVDRRTVARALEAMREVPVPVFILPGNHDPLNAATVYRSGTFVDRKPEHVQVIEDASPIQVADGVELVGAPWMSKRPVANPVDEALDSLSPARDVTRICAAHGVLDQFTPDPESSGVIAATVLEEAIAEEKVHFVALGDRHSLTRVGDGDRIWYSGTPEATDFSETRAGCALVVEVDGGRGSTKEVEIGRWRFTDWGRVDLNGADEVDLLRKELEQLENKERTVLRLTLVGALSLSLHGGLQDHLVAAGDTLAVCDVREDELLVVPDDADFADLGFSGFADGTVRRLRSTIEEGEQEGATARDALMLLLRLAGGAA